ncbi:MAG: hypothetical protein ACREP9_12400, partial [Candidatus Dormibacteraceae bacterium]
YTMLVTCQGTLNTAPTPLQFTRVVTFFACQAGENSCGQNNAIVTATANFQDLSPTGIDGCYDGADTGTCGLSMTISSWIVQSADS